VTTALRGGPAPAGPEEPTVNEDLLARYEAERAAAYRLYEPEAVSVVLGAGRRGKGDLVEESVAADGVPILARKGGGGTVVLSPGMAVLALVTEVASPYRNREYAVQINGWIREALSGLGVTGLEDRGISDLALGDVKIVGTSIFRRRLILFYQASILVENDIGLFARYLTYPSSVPDYRAGRGHDAFCTTLRRAGFAAGTREVIAALEAVVARELPRLRCPAPGPCCAHAAPMLRPCCAHAAHGDIPVLDTSQGGL
jgi:lipoate-protein ligase A